jgi:hypothetical protein
MYRKLSLMFVLGVVASLTAVEPSYGFGRHGRARRHHACCQSACCEAVPSCCGSVQSDASDVSPDKPSVNNDEPTKAAPVTAEEQKWFDEMYGASDQKKLLEETWRSEDHAARMKEYQEFKKSVEDAIKADQTDKPK